MFVFQCVSNSPQVSWTAPDLPNSFVQLRLHGAVDAVCGAPLNPKPQVSPPATSQLHDESRGGWITFPRARCAGLKEGSGGQAEMQCATMVSPSWAAWGPPPWGPLQGTVSPGGPETVHPPHRVERPSTRRHAPDSHLYHPRCL